MPLKKIGFFVEDPALKIQSGDQADTREGESDEMLIQIKRPFSRTKNNQQQDNSTGET